MKNKLILLKVLTLMTLSLSNNVTFASGIDKLMKYAAPSGPRVEEDPKMLIWDFWVLTT